MPGSTFSPEREPRQSLARVCACGHARPRELHAGASAVTRSLPALPAGMRGLARGAALPHSLLMQCSLRASARRARGLRAAQTCCAPSGIMRRASMHAR